MKRFQKKEKKFLYSKTVLFLMFLLFCFMVFSLIRFGSKLIEVKENKEVLTKKIEEMELRKQRLEEDVKELNTEEGKEKIFRENLGLAKEGEEVVVVVEEDKIEVVKEDKKSNFLIKIKEIFIKTK